MRCLHDLLNASDDLRMSSGDIVPFSSVSRKIIKFDRSVQLAHRLPPAQSNGLSVIAFVKFPVKIFVPFQSLSQQSW